MKLPILPIVVFASALARAELQPAIDFNREIRPLLSENCFTCHGPDEGKRKGKLRLDTHEGALGKGDSGEVAIVPGKSDQSEVILRILSKDKDEVMPPPKSNHQLTAEQIGLLKRWVDQGAGWGKHWAFEAPRRPAVPSIADSSLVVRNPIDNFVLARLMRDNIKPSPEADRRTLVRRLSLDLLGLPPDAQTVQAFVDDRRSDAYERLVDSLLSSPHFGERWGRYWLDLARYADSEGYLNDAVRPYAYVYRDWVIDAINRDLPFDRFTVEQLAGDLLPNATLDQKIATGFHRNTLKNGEAGADREEDRCKVAVDRVATTGAVWLGLTVGCAECHSHKYDPISQREFYSLYAFFNNSDDADIPAPRPEELAAYEKKKATWDRQRQTLQAAVADYAAAKLPAAQVAWESAARTPANTWSVLTPRTAKSAGGAALMIQPDAMIVSSGKNAPTDVYTLELTGEITAATGLQMEALGEPKKGRTVGRGRTGGAILSELTATVQRARGKPQPITFRTAITAHSPEESPITAAIDGDPTTGWSTAANVGQTHRAVFEFTEPLTLATGDKLVLTLDQRGGYGEAFRRLRFAVTADPPPLGGDTLSDDLAAILATPPASRTSEQATELARYYEQIDPDLRKLRVALQQHDAKAPANSKTKAPTLKASKPRETNVHIRGDFLRKGDRVNPGTLAVLHPFQPRAAAADSDRLDLANWLIDPANPLTSRVTVNHLWKNLFGRGLVATENDFGTRGDPPSHPELLDYLATEFIRLGWSRKQMIRLIVTSATYRQTSAARSDLLDRDPLNTLLARQNRSRVEAEVVRDIFLSTSGLLNPKIGGPSIFPPLPGFVTAVGRDKTWPATQGPDRYRRGLYIHLRRNIPYPMLLTFDAPDTSVTCTRRERSNTPLQALTLLNDPVFFECSQALGEKLAAPSGDLDQRLRSGFEHCMSRPATTAEAQALRSLYDDQLQLTHGDAKLAMVAVARVVMNLDEFITRQ